MAAKRTWLIFDGNYMAHRSLHTTGGLHYGSLATGVVYGFLRSMRSIADELATMNLVFAFDRPPGLREQLYPWYKAKRRTDRAGKKSSEEYQEFRDQVKLLRTEYLPELGFPNVFSERGYEADDVIASVVKNTDPKDQCVIVSADKDMYQLLSHRVSVYNPSGKQSGRVMTDDRFTAEYGVEPRQWAVVKAIAGCVADEVPGVRGVGDKTAASYLRGVPHHLNGRMDSFVRSPQYKVNLSVVTIPYAGCPAFTPVVSKSDQAAWRALARKLGMRTLL